MATRKYEQTRRAEYAEATRRRILDAVTESLRERPTEPVSIDSVAQRAGVARSTVYVVFGSKAGLFDAFTADLADRSGIADLTAAVAVDDPREHLRGAMRAAGRMLDRDIEVNRVLTAMNRLNPDLLGGAMARREEHRRGGMEHLAQRLAETDQLRDDVTVEQATDLLWMLCSFEAFDLLRTDRGLDVDAVADLLSTTAERALCR